MRVRHIRSTKHSNNEVRNWAGDQAVKEVSRCSTRCGSWGIHIKFTSTMRTRQSTSLLPVRFTITASSMVLFQSRSFIVDQGH